MIECVLDFMPVLMVYMYRNDASHDMSMTDKQFQGFLRLPLELPERALQKSPDNEDLKKVKDIFQSILEDE